MDPRGNTGRTRACHVVAMPYPGRGHINPMMNLCKLLAKTSDKNNILITFVVTDEWLGFIGSEPSKPDNIRFATIPNVVPSELVRGAIMPTFIEAVMTKMETPFERLLDLLETPASTIIADTFLYWAIRVGNRRNIPVASLWPMSATVFSMFNHFELLEQKGHFPFDIAEKGDERVDYIPGVSSTRLADLPTIVYGKDKDMFHKAMEAFLWLPKAQFLLFNSTYELEPIVIDSLRENFGFPVYPISSILPHYNLRTIITNTSHIDQTYKDWLDAQQKGSVLYVSFGSFLSVSNDQIDEIAAGLRDSGVRFMWVARGETPRLKEVCGDNGLVVPWCNQLTVLSHDSVGGFWSHCGWNSTQEGVFCGVPFLTFPIIMDQVPNSKQIVEDWKIGWRVNEAGLEILVKREEIARLVQRFMDLEINEVKEMRAKAKELQKEFQEALSGGGSSEANINAFVWNILQSFNR